MRHHKFKLRALHFFAAISKPGFLALASPRQA